MQGEEPVAVVAEDEVAADGAFAMFAVCGWSVPVLDVDAVAGEGPAVCAADDSQEDLADDEGQANDEGRSTLTLLSSA